MLPRQAVEAVPVYHLLFAMRYEGYDLSVLERLTHAIPDQDIANAVRGGTGIYTRRLWFIWEWLTGRELDVPDAGKITYVPALDPAAYICLPVGVRSARHKVEDNLPGTPAFCPLTRRTDVIDAVLQGDPAAQARRIIASAPPTMVSRAVSFMLLSDSKSSFAIEGEKPGPARTARWARAIGGAGVTPFSTTELERLQQIVIEDTRFIRMGIRKQGGFVGGHDRHTHAPQPDHISARHDDLGSLMEGLRVFEERALAQSFDPITTAAMIAFGFVFIHPFEDGNGRLHRYLIHHILTRAGFNPPGVVFPVSAVIERRILDYKKTLEAVTAPRVELIDWVATPKNNVEVTNQTAHLYRYFDATKATEFLAQCVLETVEKDLPQEIAYLQGFDQFSLGVQQIVDMPGPLVDLLLKFLNQNAGTLSKRALKGEFKSLNDQEVSQIEDLYAESWPKS